MAYFLNKNFKNSEFELMAKDKYFVDKSKLIDEINKQVNVKDRFICITRPRRFGKTVNAMMLASYYSKTADFKDLFDKLEISKCESYLEHLHKHNVIYITLNEVPKTNCTYQEFIDRYISLLLDDLTSNFPDLEIKPSLSLSDILGQIYQKYGQSFIFILDEWDYIFNNNLFTEEERESFLYFLKDLLKDREYVELAYMTGVLPIAKYSSGSALNMFDEFTFLNDNCYDKYFGFVKQEVANIQVKQEKVSLEKLQEWYDGYQTCGGNEIYNPRSVVFALRRGSCQSYWTNTGPMDEIIYHIKNNVEELKDDVVKMVSGMSINIQLKGYGAERNELNTRNQILSAMTIYGFLSYYQGELRIPNKELRMKFDDALEDKSMGEVSKLVLRSNEMLEATLRKDCQTVAEIIQEAHDINIPVIKYNDENSLSCTVILAYLSARNSYNIVREMPAGVGFADFIFYPNDKSKPAFILELKRNSTAAEAIKQIKEKRYITALKDYTGRKLLVGIAYDSKKKEHQVEIEEV